MPDEKEIDAILSKAGLLGRTEKEVKEELQQKGMTSWRGPLKKAPPTAKDFWGRFANMLGTTSGAYLLAGAGAGPVGLGAALAGGAGLGAILPPSEQPMTDIATTLAEPALVRAAGGLSKLPAVWRGLGGAGIMGGGTGLSSWMGAQLDREALDKPETPWGRILLYSGVGAVGQGLHGMVQSGFAPNAAWEAAERIRQDYDVAVPLGMTEATGAWEGFSNLMLVGTKALKTHAEDISAAALRAVDKILGTSHRAGTEGLEVAIRGGRKEARGQVSAFVREFRTRVREERAAARLAQGQPAEQTLEEAITAHIREAGRGEPPGGGPIKIVWSEFDAKFGLTREERDAFFLAIHRKPFEMSGHLMPKSPGDWSGTKALQALEKVLPEQDFARLGSSLVMQMLLSRRVFSTETMHGLRFIRALEDWGPHLERALGPARAKGLRDLAEVMTIADPALLPRGISASQRVLTYGVNKAGFRLMFPMAGGAAGAGIGGAAGGVPGALLGAAAAAGVMIPIHVAIARTLADPGFARLMIGAARGDATAGLKILRSLLASQTEQEVPFAPASTVRTRLGFLFGR